MMKTLQKMYWIFRLAFIQRLAYRVNFLLEMVSGIFSSLIVIFLWMAVYRHSSQEVLGGYSLAEMVTYLLGGGLINSMIMTTAENYETSQNIQDGTLSSLLLQPISPYWVWLLRDFASKIFFFLLGWMGYLVVFLFFRAYLLRWASWEHLLLFLTAIALGAMLQFLLFESLSLLAFWLENTYGIRFTARVILEVAGGAIIPLSFFPSVLQEILLRLPFSFIVYLPMRIYLGKIALEAIHLELMKESIWIAALALLNRWLWRRGLRTYSAMGD
jgi:ABC-2 type transport system permease protein